MNGLPHVGSQAIWTGEYNFNTAPNISTSKANHNEDRYQLASRTQELEYISYFKAASRREHIPGTLSWSDIFLSHNGHIPRERSLE